MAVKYNHINFTPPSGARKAAKRALEVRESKPPSERGMTAVGIARARDLINGVKLSPKTVRRMKAYFDRHQVDKNGSTWDEQGKGWQAWQGWGGDSGYSWAKKVVRQMNVADKKERSKQYALTSGDETISTKPTLKSSLQMMDLSSDFVGDFSNSETVSLKGFASVETVDRDGEIVSPLSFNIESFMNSPTLLVNHEYYTDKQGNRVAVGKVTKMSAAYISAESGDEWEIKDINTDELVGLFPKAKVPKLGVGDRGLFVEVDVTQPEIVSRVVNGDYGAFSWKGLTRKKTAVIDGEPVNRLSEVDLWEISLVNVPANNQATFVKKNINDSIDDLYVVQVQVSKSRFKTPESASNFLLSHHLSVENMRDDNGWYTVQQESPELYEISKSVRVRVNDDSVFILSPKKLEKPADLEGVSNSLPCKVGVRKMRLFSLNPDSLKALGDFNTVEKTLKIGETEIEVVEVSFKNVEVAAEVPDFAKMIEGKFQELEGKLDLTSFSNKISALESELNQIRESLSAKNAEQAGNTEAAAVAEEKKDEEVQEALKALQAQLEAVSKSIIVLGSAVAPQNARKEESAKSADVKPSEYDGFFGQFFK